MNKVLKISISVFLIVVSKVILDIILLSVFLEGIQQINLLQVIGYTCAGSLVVLLIYNKLQRLYPFVASVSFAFYILSIQYVLYYGYPVVIKQNYMLLTIPGFIITGNLLLFLIFKGLSNRITNENFNITEKIVSLSKSAGLLIGSAFVIFLVLKLNIRNLAIFHSTSLIAFLVGFFFLIELILNIDNGNDIIENAQVIKVSNKLKHVLKNPFFIILFFTSLIIGIVLTMAFRAFTNNTLHTLNTFAPIVRLFGFYTLFMAVLGLGYELFLRQKLLLYLGIKNALRMLPIFISLLAAVLLYDNFAELSTKNSDWQFIFLIVTVFMMIFSHFSFENISIPTTYAFYFPIGVEIRHDFYVKSFMFGIIGGIGIGSVITTTLTNVLPFTEDQILPFAIIAFAAFLFYLNSSPVYKSYRNELQSYLNNQSRKLIINKGLFKDIDNNNPNNFKGIQFVRYINLLYLSNPVIARKAIQKTITSENNLTQRVSLIKAGEICMLETLEDLFAIKKTKYFPSSPNRDKIDSVISRFMEVSQRMNSKRYIEQLSISKDDNERVFGAKLVYYSKTDEKKNIINRLLKDPNLPVVINAIISSQSINNIVLIKSIADKLDSPALGNAAYSTLLSCGTVVLPIVEESFYETGQTEKVQIRLIQLYGDIANEEATEYLLKKLNISNQNIISQALASLSKCSLALSADKSTMLRHELEELCKVLVWNMSLLIDTKRNNSSEVLRAALKVELDENYKSMFNLLSLLYDSKSIKLIQNNLFSNDIEKISFALELASVLLKDELKLLIIPLLQPLPLEEKVSFMQDQIPTEKLQKRDVLYMIIQRDSKWMNQWTKACAMSELTEDKIVEDVPILLANMINPDPMIAELAANSVFKLDSEVYYKNKKVFGVKYSSLFDQTVVDRIENKSSKEDVYPVMKYDIINSLHQVPEFSSISGEILKRLTDYILPVKVLKGEILEEIENLDVQNYFYILYSGNVSLYGNNKFIKSFTSGSFISTLDLLTDEKLSFTLISEKDSILYRISSYGFTELLTIFDLIPETIVKNTINKNLSEYEDFIKRRTRRDSVEKTMNELLSISQN